jgi:hypothetical protein
MLLGFEVTPSHCLGVAAIISLSWLVYLIEIGWLALVIQSWEGHIIASTDSIALLGRLYCFVLSEEAGAKKLNGARAAHQHCCTSGIRREYLLQRYSNIQHVRYILLYGMQRGCTFSHRSDRTVRLQ